MKKIMLLRCLYGPCPVQTQFCPKRDIQDPSRRLNYEENLVVHEFPRRHVVCSHSSSLEDDGGNENHA